MVLLFGACLLLVAVAGLVAAKSRQRRKVRARRAERQRRLNRDWWVWTWFSRSSRHKRLTYDPQSDRD